MYQFETIKTLGRLLTRLLIGHQMLFLLSFVVLVDLAHAQNSPGLVQASPTVVNWLNLKSELEGFAANATGGLNGSLYQVTSNKDYDTRLNEAPIVGTLRYALEVVKRETPLWITFASNVNKIILKAPLNIYSHTTIDGRGRDVTLATKVNWRLYKKVDGGTSRTACKVRTISEAPGVTPQELLYANTTMIQISRSENIIITHLKLTRDNFSNPDFGDDDANMDKECLGDMIAVSNTKSNSDPAPTSNLWFNHLTIEKCGDGCIDTTRPESTAQYISISNNRFNRTDKTMLLGQHLDSEDNRILAGKFYYRISLYNNYFYKTNERNPKAVYVLLHAYNNFYNNVQFHALNNMQSRVFFERNLFHGPFVSGDEGTIRYQLPPPNPSAAEADVAITFLSNNKNTTGSLVVPNSLSSTQYESLRSSWVKANGVSVPFNRAPASLDDFNNSGWVP